jgi:hypothetical protein
VTIADFFTLVKTILFLFTTGCKARFALISKNPENTMKVERPDKKAFFKMNHNLPS